MHLDCQNPLFRNQRGYKLVIFVIPITLTLITLSDYEQERKSQFALTQLSPLPISMPQNATLLLDYHQVIVVQIARIYSF
jgi:hypothetical protein